MKTSLILTLIGPDRPGLVSAVSACAGAHGANWMESRLTRLAGQFAGVVRLEVDAAAAAALERGLLGLGAEGLQLAVVRADAAAAAQPRLARLELVGHDRPASCATSRRCSPATASASTRWRPLARMPR